MSSRSSPALSSPQENMQTPAELEQTTEIEKNYYLLQLYCNCNSRVINTIVSKKIKQLLPTPVSSYNYNCKCNATVITPLPIELFIQSHLAHQQYQLRLEQQLHNTHIQRQNNRNHDCKCRILHMNHTFNGGKYSSNHRIINDRIEKYESYIVFSQSRIAIMKNEESTALAHPPTTPIPHARPLVEIQSKPLPLSPIRLHFILFSILSFIIL